jgi:hypothetical protein
MHFSAFDWEVENNQKLLKVAIPYFFLNLPAFVGVIQFYFTDVFIYIQLWAILERSK